MVEARRKKARSRSKEEEAQRGLDRLSILPDSVINHILSFIDTKYAVQTSVLSKKWKNLWTSLPNLNFHKDSFRTLAAFSKFVCRVLSRRDGSNIFTLKFASRWTSQPWLVKKVIVFALSHNVQDLSVNVYSYTYSPSLSLSFNCPSSKNLQLRTFRKFNSLTKFESLTTLLLSGFCFFDSQNTCSDFFSKWVNLKNLSLINCSTSGLDVFNIFCPQLANLTFSRGEFNNSFSDNCKIVISAPKLTFLHFDLFDSQELSLVNPSSLENVKLGACLYPKPSAEKLIKLLQELSNAKNITLLWKVIEVLSIVLDLSNYQLPLFGDLKTLKLQCVKSGKSTVSDNVKSYLQNCSPNAIVSMEFLR